MIINDTLSLHSDRLQGEETATASAQSGPWPLLKGPVYLTFLLLGGQCTDLESLLPAASRALAFVFHVACLL